VPAAGVDVQLCALGAASDIVSRAASLCGVDPGTGNAATLVYTPADTGWSGLVLLNNSLTAGNVTVYADTSAPTGSVSIDSGAPTTTSPDVTLALAGSDVQTGVMSMQISTDGTFDTEPVLPYSTSGTATLPGPNGAKTVSVRYLNNAGMWSAPFTDNITLNAIDVTSVAPAAGPLGGGNTVTVKGDGFTGATSVKFGTTPASSFTVVNSKTITVSAPAHAAGPANVRVTRPSGSSPISPGSKYTYAAAPVVTSLTPSAGPLGGGNTVTINGTGFTGVTSVKFGSTVATSYTVVNATKITAVAPSHAAGAAQVHVTTSSGMSPSAAGNKYTYEAAPTVTAISPASGPTAGGTTVTITGTNLTGATAVKFGATSATSYVVVNSTKITAVAPAHVAGAQFVHVVTASGTSASVAASKYTYG
jgi:hypothetical protein